MTAISSAAAAQLRAMPVSRLIDAGMESADATALTAAVLVGDEWSDVAEQIGERQLARASAVNVPGGGVAGERDGALRAAAAAFNFAQMSISQDIPRKIDLYARFTSAIEELAIGSKGRIRRIELPFGRGALVGWLCLPFEPTDHPPTVIQWGGLSGWGATYLNSADALNRRGIACLLAEGPGQGTPRLRDLVFLDADFVAGFSEFVGAVIADPQLGELVGIQGNSFGGLFAAHVAASDNRVMACVVNGAPSAPTLPEFRTAREQLLSALGIAAPEAEAFLPRLAFDPQAQRIGCPLLVLQGGADPLATPQEQAGFLAAGDPELTTQQFWSDGEHTIYNHADERDALVAEWFSRAFESATTQSRSASSHGS